MRLGLSAALVAVLTLTGCPEEQKPVVDPACTAADPCKDGLVCSIQANPALNACLPCKKDGECARDEFCHPIDRRCRLRPCFGNECRVHDDCALGKFCVQGLCLAASQPNENNCAVVSCAEGETCNEGDRCHPVNFVCEADLGCDADTDCGEGLHCNVGAHTCDNACTPANAVEVCGLKRVCDSAGTCVDCLKDHDCGSGLSCDLTKKTCVSFTSCSTDADCDIPLVCNRLTHECTEKPPPCLSAEDCGDGETCQLSTGRCVSAICQKDRFEPDDVLAEAREVPIGSTPNLTVCAGDVDLYKIALGLGDRLQAIIDMDTLLPFEVSIMTGTGEVVAKSDYAVNAIANVEGTYYVRARSDDQFVRYGLRIAVSRGVPCQADEFEPNRSYLAANALGAGDQFGLTLCPGDEDWFAVSSTAGQAIEVQLASTPTDGDLDLYVYDSNGTKELGRSASTAEVETVTTAAFSGNRVFVRVVGASPGTQNVYDLFVRVR